MRKCEGNKMSFKKNKKTNSRFVFSVYFYVNFEKWECGGGGGVDGGDGGGSSRVG